MHWQHIPSIGAPRQNYVADKGALSHTGLPIAKGNETPQSREELTDGQISIALNSDLLDLINNITDQIAQNGLNYANCVDSNIGDVKRPKVNTWNSFGESSTARTAHSSMRGVSPRHRDIDTANWRSLEPVNTSWVDQSSASPRHRPQGSWSSSPRHGSYISASGGDVEPLPQVLDQLDNEDEECVVVVRRITKLGFKSNRIIKAAFGDLGWKVKNVVLLPSRSKTVGDDQHTVSSHARPSSMGFAVFADKKDAQACLKNSKLTIDGVEILVQPFSRQYKSSNSPTHSLRTST